jgi:hypothetical protein
MNVVNWYLILREKTQSITLLEAKVVETSPEL